MPAQMRAFDGSSMKSSRRVHRCVTPGAVGVVSVNSGSGTVPKNASECATAAGPRVRRVAAWVRCHDAAAARREPLPAVGRRAGLGGGAHLGADLALGGAVGLPLQLGLMAGLADFFLAAALEAVVPARAQRRVPISSLTISDFLMSAPVVSRP